MPVCSSVALQRTPLGRRKARHTATLNFITRMDLLLVPPMSSSNPDSIWMWTPEVFVPPSIWLHRAPRASNRNSAVWRSQTFLCKPPRI